MGAARKSGRLLAIICSLAAPAILYLIVRTGVVGLNPALAASLPPANAAVVLRQKASQAAHPDYKVDAPTLALAKEALEDEPLDFRPFYFAARAAEQARDLPRAIALLEEARRRRPTWLPIRLMLVSTYFRGERRREMVRELDYVLRMNEQARMILLPELVKLMRFSDGRRYIAEMLSANPPWRGDFFNTARERRVPPQFAEDLLRIASAQRRDTSEEQRLLVATLIAAGRPEEARARWLQSLAPAERERSAMVHDTEFEGSAGAGEFGWGVAALGEGRGDIVPGASRLRAIYDGGSVAILARQLIALRPGRYRLSVTGRLPSPEGAQQLLWTMLCHPDGPSLLRLPVIPLGEQEKTISGVLTVPAGRCAAQSLRLVGEPGDLSIPVEAEFTKIEIVREN